jgi:D-alanyl-D-alanine carboxypeptidase
MDEGLEAKVAPKAVALAVVKPAPVDVAKADLRPDSRVEASRPEPATTDTSRLEPPRPIQVAASGPVETGKTRPAFVSGSTSDYRGVSLDGSTRTGLVAAAVVPSTTPANGMRWIAGPKPAEGQGKMTLRVETKVAAYQPQQDLPNITAPAAKAIEVSTRPAAAASGYMIQIGATDAAPKAQDLLDRAKAASRGVLKTAVPFTEKVSRESGTMYRARFAGLTETQAEAACKTLKRSGLGCFTTRN